MYHWFSGDGMLHAVELPQFALFLRDEQLGSFQTPLLERAIGVIYRPQTERQSHYFHAILPSQFDAIVHFDHTTALRPLEVTAAWQAPDMAETYPSGV